MMGFTKIQKVESYEILSDQEVSRINEAIQKVGKISLAEVSEKDRQEILDS
jgi:hypothetical protein